MKKFMNNARNALTLKALAIREKLCEEITVDKIKTVEVGGYNLPEDVVKNLDTALGKYASADLAVGDYIITSKIADEPAAENAYLYNLTGEKQAISVTVKAFANGLSGKLHLSLSIAAMQPTALNSLKRRKLC